MILNIARKELKSLFASPMGWIILAILMMAFGSYYLTGVNNYFEVMSGAIRPAERVGVTIFVGQTVYSIASFIMLFAVPLLTMRLISEERRSQTLPFLFSAPISLTEIVLGKFVGLIVFLSILSISSLLRTVGRYRFWVSYCKLNRSLASCGKFFSIRYLFFKLNPAADYCCDFKFYFTFCINDYGALFCKRS